MLKGKARLVADSNPAGDSGTLRDNPKVNAKIDDWIKNNPKHWAYIEAMPTDRMNGRSRCMKCKRTSAWKSSTRDCCAR